MKISHLFREIQKGRTLGRAIQNHAFSTIKLKGSGIDLGAGTNSSSYYEFLKLEPGTEIQYTDLIPKSEGVIQVDLEGELSIPDNSQDFIILNNLLEHVYNFHLCTAECYRILKPEGVIVGVVPFFHRIHPDPDDYFRYTKSSLIRIFSEAGFGEINIEALGYGVFSSCANTLVPILKFRLLMFGVYLASIMIDKLIGRLGNIFSRANVKRGESWSHIYTPLCYLFICRK